MRATSEEGAAHPGAAAADRDETFSSGRIDRRPALARGARAPGLLVLHCSTTALRLHAPGRRLEPLVDQHALPEVGAERVVQLAAVLQDLQSVTGLRRGVFERPVSILARAAVLPVGVLALDLAAVLPVDAMIRLFASVNS
jgi:hypothetical protein